MNATKQAIDIIQGGAAMSDLQFLEAEIAAHLSSEVYREMVLGKRYYRYKQPIDDKVRTGIGEGGKIEILHNLPNNRFLDNQYAKQVDKKTNYLLSLKFSVDGENKQYVDLLNQVFNRRFRKVLKRVGSDTLKCGLGYLYPLPKGDEIHFIRLEPEQCLPFWQDQDHTELDALAHIYPVQEYKGHAKEIVNRVDFYDTTGVTRYEYKDGKLKLLEKVTHLVGEEPLNWEKVPIISFRSNADEISVFTKVKSLQDGINTILSTFGDHMMEDSRSTIMVVINYAGENLGEFRNNLNKYGAVKVTNDGDGKGGDLKTLKIEVNAENYKVILQLLKEKLIENAGGLDAKNDKMSGTPNQMNIKSMYSDMDLDANDMEAEFQASMENLLWFVKKWLKWTGKGDFSNEVVNIEFNRDILMVESEVIENTMKLQGVVSTETLLSQLPMVDDVAKEIARKEKEREEEEERFGQFTSQKET